MGLAEVSDSIVEQRRLLDHSCIDRRLVHRTALSEVFLTDSEKLSGAHFVVAAQLPPSHAYFTDHVSRGAVLDPLLILECCRQAETLVSHRYMGVPMGHNFILTSWSMTFGGLSHREKLGRCATIRLDVYVESPRYVAGQLRSVTYRIEISAESDAANVNIGFLSMSVKYTSREVYQEIRSSRRTSAVMTNSDLIQERTHLVDSASVARRSEQNVVLSHLHRTSAGIRARMNPPFDNPSFFDHAQDHVPAMVLVEAARQLSLIALGDECGLSPMHTHVSDLNGTFYDYVELDAMAELVVTDLETRADDRDPGTLFSSTVHVDVVQASKVMSRIRLELATTRGALKNAAVPA